MDPLSAISSVIAILQGVAATKHVVNLIKEIPEIQNEYEDLRKELLLLEYMVNHASPIASNNPITNIVQEKLGKILTDLREIEKKCTRDANDGKSSKAKRHRWIMEGNKIQKLREKACSAKHDLSIILGINQRDMMDNIRQETSLGWERMEKLMMKQENFVQWTITDRKPKDSRRIEEVLDDKLDQAIVENRTSDSIETTDALYVQSDLTFRLREPPRTELIQRIDSTLFMGVVPMTVTGCSETCQCRCHFHRPLPNAATWMESLVGSWRLGYTGTQASRTEACIAGCKGRLKGDLKIEYRPPAWLGNTWPTLDLRFALRPPAIIEDNDDVWFYMLKGPEEISTHVRYQFSYFPDQDDGTGLSIAEYALQCYAWGFLEILFQVLWKNLLPRQGLSRDVFFLANDILEKETLGDRETHLCQLARSWADDGEEMRRTELHEAILSRGDIEEAISNQPWAVDVLDYSGYAPIHIAAERNSVVAIDALIKANADINQKNCIGWTALMLAARNARLEAVKRLIDAKCGLHIRPNDGLTAFHTAVWSGSVIVVQEMLRAGSSPHLHGPSGRTPLHMISMSRVDEKTADEIIRLLLAAKADIEATHNGGWTPILEALGHNNVTVLRCLFQMGASPYVVTRYSYNILHIAASQANAESLRFLINQNLVGINTELEDAEGMTSWQLAFRLSLQEPGLWGGWRWPNHHEQHLIYQLLRGVEDRNFWNIIDTLESVSQWATQMDKTAAIEALAPLIKQMDDWNQDVLLFDCVDIQQFIDDGDWDAATNLINDCVENVRAKVGVSPWCPQGLLNPSPDNVTGVVGEEESDTDSSWETESQGESYSEEEEEEGEEEEEEEEERSLASTDNDAVVEQQTQMTF